MFSFFSSSIKLLVGKLTFVALVEILLSSPKAFPHPHRHSERCPTHESLLPDIPTYGTAILEESRHREDADS